MFYQFVPRLLLGLLILPCVTIAEVSFEAESVVEQTLTEKRSWRVTREGNVPKEGKQWGVANDEQNPADLGIPPDPGFEGHSGKAQSKNGKAYDLHDIRRNTLWGNLMAGGAGVEYYFGYKLPENDRYLENFRSRDRSWDFCRIAMTIFHEAKVPFWEMENANALVGNPKNENGKPWCLAKSGDAYLVYFPEGAKAGSLPVDDEGALSEVETWDPIGEGKKRKMMR